MYELVEEASKVLRTPPLKFDFENPSQDPKEVEEQLANAMENFGGIGLSANQVGLDVRCFVMRTQDGAVCFFNPELTKVSQETDLLKEGCLSFPFLFLSIKRPKWCSVRYTDENGEEIEETLHGMSARIFMHENEHMNGYVFTDLVSKLKLERAEKSKQKMIKEIKRRQSGITF